jgi:hypothetical protein
MFEMDELYKSLINKQTKYELKKDYQYFSCNIVNSVDKKKSKKKSVVFLKNWQLSKVLKMGGRNTIYRSNERGSTLTVKITI